MKTSKFSDSQILAILKQAEADAPVPELCREHGMSSATFYKWRARFGGMDASMMARLKKCMPKSDSKRTFSKRPLKKSGEAVAPAGVSANGGAGKIHSGQTGLYDVSYQRNLLPVSTPAGR